MAAKDPKPNWADDPPPTVVKTSGGDETAAGRALAKLNAENTARIAKILEERAANG